MSISDSEETPIIPFKLDIVEGDKGQNWLIKMDIGTTFAAKYPKESLIQLTNYRVLWKGRRAVRLALEGGAHISVDSVSFSRLLELIEVLETREEDIG